MRFFTTVIVTALFLCSSYTVEAQILPADNIIMRVRQVCNTGLGGTLIGSFEIKPRTNMWPPNYGRIGGYSVVFTFTSSKLVLTGVQQRYNPNYWGSPYRSEGFGVSAWYNQQANTGNPNQALPVDGQFFSPATDCTGNPLGDGYFEIMRYTFTILASASGTVDLGLYDVQPYNTYPYQQGVHMTAIFSPDVSTNLNDSVRMAIGLVIPVELSAFNVTARPDGSMMLTWRTETETENMGFEIERRNGDQFERIGFVSGRGTTTEANDYTFIDETPKSDRDGKVVAYRLKQIDLDGTYNYSEIQSAILIPGRMGLEAAYPNPANLGTAIRIPYTLPVAANVTLHVYNALGQHIASVLDDMERQAGHHTAVWNTQNAGNAIPAGVYFVRFNATIGGENIQEMRQVSIIR